jgi:hypothetical protein
VSRSVRTLSCVLLLVGSVATLAAACGNAKYTYVKNSGEKTYFKVPAGWHKIEQDTLDRALSGDDPDSASAQVKKEISWSIAYDGATDPSANHLMGGNDQPFVYASIRQLTDGERGVISLNHLRDIFLPVTDEARQTAQTQGAPFDDFELLRDQELTPGRGIRGVRETYNYSVPLGGLQTYDLTAYVSDDGHMYLMIVRCSARCFRERSGELESIVKSFTVRKQ